MDTTPCPHCGAKIKINIASVLGKRGGQKTKQRGKAYYQAIGRAGAKKRWNKTER